MNFFLRTVSVAFAALVSFSALAQDMARVDVPVDPEFQAPFSTISELFVELDPRLSPTYIDFLGMILKGYGCKHVLLRVECPAVLGTPRIAGVYPVGLPDLATSSRATVLARYALEIVRTSEPRTAFDPNEPVEIGVLREGPNPDGNGRTLELDYKTFGEGFFVRFRLYDFGEEL